MNAEIETIVKQANLTIGVDQHDAFERAIKLVVIDVLIESIEKGIIGADGTFYKDIKARYGIGDPRDE